ncbi:MAG TPA: hypothetical protein VGK87_10785 [Anaerolineae bacterium]|jgi:hypothetical protein
MMTETPKDENIRLLEQIESGELSVAEAMRRLEAAGATPAQEQSAPSPTEYASSDSQPASTDPDIEKWKRWWTLPFAIGVGITALAALLMLSAIQASGYGFWFVCLWAPFTAGVVVMALAWISRTARWLHVRVHTGKTDWPRQIAISVPIPIRLTAWALRTFGSRLPKLRHTSLDELILALGDSATPAHPLYIDVNEGSAGERVQVFIG